MTALVVGTALAVITVCAPLWWARRRFLVVTVVGDSMLPGLRPGERRLARRLARRRPQVGAVVIFRRPSPWQSTHDWRSGRFIGARGHWLGAPPANPELIVKRLVAVDGDPLPAPLAHLAAQLGHRVPDGYVLVLGDNPARSYDSREFGYLRWDAVVGALVGRRLPAPRDVPAARAARPHLPAATGERRGVESPGRPPHNRQPATQDRGLELDRVRPRIQSKLRRESIP